MIWTRQLQTWKIGSLSAVVREEAVATGAGAARVNRAGRRFCRGSGWQSCPGCFMAPKVARSMRKGNQYREMPRLSDPCSGDRQYKKKKIQMYDYIIFSARKACPHSLQRRIWYRPSTYARVPTFTVSLSHSGHEVNLFIISVFCILISRLLRTVAS